MAQGVTPSGAERDAGDAGVLARRVALARQPNPEDVSGPPLKLLLGELEWALEPVRRFTRTMDVARSANPRMVLLLPGFGVHPARMRYFARQIERAGHKVKRWGLGFNFGPDPERFAVLEQRLVEIYERYGRQKVYLVGWSLGGLFARELAQRHPDKIAKVISMGSPFSGSKRANNVWRVYELITGHSVDKPPIESDTAAKPPVPTVAMWSPRDGMIRARCACGAEGERDKAVALRCTHIGFSYAPEAIAAVLAELEDGEEIKT